MTGTPFQPWLDRWGLVPDGVAFRTEYTGSWLLPVRRNGVRAMLKIAEASEEEGGGALMAWWDGDGAAPVLAREGKALLLERAMGRASLMEMARNGRDDAATWLVCETVARLHRPRDQPRPSTLVPLDAWFTELAPMARARGGVLAKAHHVATRLLSDPQDVVVLHGDIHHENILDFGQAGWLAIDPKGLIGERGYDYANTLRNPDMATAAAPGRLARQAALVGEAAGLEWKRLLMWVLAHAGLSASWTLGDGRDATWSLTIAEIAAAELGL